MSKKEVEKIEKDDPIETTVIDENVEDTTVEAMEDSTNTETKKPPKKKLGKYIAYLLLILGLTGLVLGLSLSGNTVYKGVEMPTVQVIGIVFRDMDYYYILGFIGMLIAINLIGAFVLFLFARLYTKHYKYHQALANQYIGTFYNNITPGINSGGQFAQAITFKKQGLHISNAASVMVMQFIVYQTCLLFLGLISLFKIDKVLAVKFITLGEDIEIPIVVFVILGFCVNAIIICTLYVMSYSRTIHNFVLNKLVNLLGKMKIFRDPDKKREELRVQVENFRIELRRLQSNIPFTILIYILTFLTLMITDSFPYVIGLSLNAFEGPANTDVFNRLFESIVFTNYHQMICGVIPIPGSAGVSEFVFTQLFKGYYNNPAFGEGGAKTAMLIWRLITYYVPFILGAIVAATYKSRGLKTEERFYSLDRNTFATLQLETYEERKASSDTAYETASLERKELLQKLKLIKYNDQGKSLYEEKESKENEEKEKKKNDKSK